MLIEVFSHLLDFVLQRFSVSFGFLKMPSGVCKTLVIVLANGELILDGF